MDDEQTRMVQREAAQGDPAARDRLAVTWPLVEGEGSMLAREDWQHRRAHERGLATTGKLRTGDLVAVRLAAKRASGNERPFGVLLGGAPFLASVLEVFVDKANVAVLDVSHLPGPASLTTTMGVLLDDDEIVVLRRNGTLPRVAPRTSGL